MSSERPFLDYSHLTRGEFLRLVALGTIGALFGSYLYQEYQKTTSLDPEYRELFSPHAQATVCLAKPIDKGWVMGGGIFIAPHTLLTAKHLAVDPDFIYAAGPEYGNSFSRHQYQHDISRVYPHPEVDLALIQVNSDHPFLEPASLNDQLPVTISQVSSLSYHQSLEKVTRVGSWNQSGKAWPAGSSFACRIGTIGPGDSGGPVFQKDKVVGISHGDRPLLGSIYVNLTPFLPWIRSLQA
jgi:hypothetical protein